MEINSIKVTSHEKRSKVEYDLKVITKKATMTLNSLFKITTPINQVNFERNSNNIQSVMSWVIYKNKDRLDRQGIENLIANYTLKNNKGVIFSGNIQKLPDGDFNIKLIGFKLAVGKSYFINDINEANIKKIPNGFSSYYLDDHNQDLSSLQFLKDMPNLNVNISYIVPRENILPVYIADVSYIDNEEKKFMSLLKCENCEQKIAEKFCKEDFASICSDCDTLIHISKLQLKHNRIPINEASPFMIRCDLHPIRFCEFFCPSCHFFVCLDCKMIGHHSLSSAANHPLIPISDAYKNILESFNAYDPELEEKRKLVEIAIEKMEKKGKDILKESNEIEVLIKNIYNESIEKLKIITDQRLKNLKSEAMEFQRVLSEFLIHNQFIQHLKNGSNPSYLLSNWYPYISAKANLPKCPNVSNLMKDDKPITLEGYINIKKIEEKSQEVPIIKEELNHKKDNNKIYESINQNNMFFDQSFILKSNSTHAKKNGKFKEKDYSVNIEDVNASILSLCSRRS